MSSALYVVDLKKFRETAAGDNLRVFYESLSKDPNSLSNLDQASVLSSVNVFFSFEFILYALFLTYYKKDEVPLKRIRFHFVSIPLESSA